jgi:hypothetical protein
MNIEKFISDINRIPAKQKNDGLYYFIHSFLIDREIRDGWLFQYIDIIDNNNENEDITRHATSDKIIEIISKNFPDFYYLEDNQGLLISKRPITIEEFTDDNKIGKILGYPCKFSNNYIARINFIDKKNNKHNLFAFNKTYGRAKMKTKIYI